MKRIQSAFSQLLVLLTFIRMSMGWMSMMKRNVAVPWSMKKQQLLVGTSKNRKLFSTVGDNHDDNKIMAEIIGSGRIGSFLAQGGECILLGRTDTIDPNKGGYPIIIATRNDALHDIIMKCPENRKKDLLFVQNGYLDDFLQEKGLLQDATQVLLYLSVTAKGVTPIDGVTSYNPEGLTTATGIHAQSFAKLLQSLNMKCNVVQPKDYRPAMFEKLIWICTYMLVGTAKQCKSVGEAGKEYTELIQQIIQELMTAIIKKEGIEFQPGTIDRLAAYTDVVTDFPCAVKEFEWRNKYFYNLGNEQCPIHNNLLKECEQNGLISFSLP